MNKIIKQPVSAIGYGFIAPEYLPQGKDEYHLRNKYNKSGIEYRSLSASEIEILVRNNNTSDNWNHILVSEKFDPQLVKNCSFFGLVRIGKLEPFSLEFHDLILPVGLFNSTIISCDFGDNVCIHNVNYFSHYVVGNDVMIANVNELAITSTAKFGNGVVKQGESEQTRIWLELCNENGGRKVLPFNGMLPADAYLWSKYRDDQALMDAFYRFTVSRFDDVRGHYGKIGDRTVIKNCKMIKDVLIGTDAYIKGANKIKNVTINSTEESNTQIGEGVELVNGIVGVGCRIFYGVKAVRFFMASHSQLKYGARLINSYLGNNATISCCEVLNSLIYPFHEQHHNNSFLCASLLMGQTNVAAGATIGSNHNSRGADGELIAGRGFWPGLCVSLKHNSKFASFTLLAKGDFPFELHIPLPFSLVINDSTSNELRILPAYWFQYNYYALQRNEWKYKDRDARLVKELALEYNSLAPDSVNEIFEAMHLIKLFTGKAYYRKEGKSIPADELCLQKGDALLSANDAKVDELEVLADGFENSKRKVVILKVRKAFAAYKEMVRYYALGHLINRLHDEQDNLSLESVHTWVVKSKREQWANLGGQLVPSSLLQGLLQQVKKGKVNSWEGLHQFYADAADAYEVMVLHHAIASLIEVEGIRKKEFVATHLLSLLDNFLEINERVYKGIVQSRKKDMTNPFRKMVYDSDTEQEAVVGKLNDNAFIRQKDNERKALKRNVSLINNRINALLKA
jgi:hypothetical protein